MHRLKKGNLAPGATVSVGLNITTSQWFSEQGDFEIYAVQGGEEVSNRFPFTVTAPQLAVPTFTDATASSGITTSLPEGIACHWSAGGAWADYDGDGSLDLYVPSRTRAAELWMNDGTGSFSDEAVARGADNGGSAGIGAVAADYDNDGDADIYVSNSGSNRLYVNDGSGNFSDMAPQLGVDDAGVSISASWADYDNDGRLDLYSTNYGRCNPHVAEYDKLYHQEADGTFSDQTALLDKDLTTRDDGSTDGFGFQASWFDYDTDGDQDLYLGNDYLKKANGDHNRMFRNDGPDGTGGWTFTDVSSATASNYRMNTMGAAIGDYDRDLDFDMSFVEHGREEVRPIQLDDGRIRRGREVDPRGQPVAAGRQDVHHLGAGLRRPES